MLETAKNCGGRIEEIVCEDRISALPEVLLVNILKYVPTKYAVTTMILSKQWRYIWTMLTKLDYIESDDDDDDDDDDERKKSVWWFLDKSMQLHKAPVLHMLLIELGRRCPTDVDVGKWVAKAVDRCVFLLKLDLHWSADPISLPKTLYSCKSLNSLTLCNKILVDFPSTAYLPSLTMLNLICVVYKNEDSLITVVSNCPVLEDLNVQRRKDDNLNKFTVKVPSLLKLGYMDYWSDDDDVEEDTGSCLVVHTPALTEFDYTGYSCSIENMPCLEQVSIHLDRSFPDVDKFLTSFSTVLFLELYLTDEMIVSWRSIEFSRLEKCKIFPWDSDWMDSLLCFLQNTPKLKFFIVDYAVTNRPPNASVWWSQTISDPECLSSSLEKFELIDYGGRKEEKELVEYILTTSKCLKSATISMRSTTLKLEDVQEKDIDEDESTDEDEDTGEDEDEDEETMMDEDKDKETMMKRKAV
ncbi:putative FBD-associated F-box protein [Cardamine amara subsp. amara]|uniref:FBD-associated F-box protein n=1 Tax=Cardamine amara subsp. amara TaxID=228776 RepID=A0ABD1B9C4_CARAN